MNFEKLYDLKNWTSFDVEFSLLTKPINYIPNEAGLYMIFTDTPKEVFQKLEFINKKGAVDFNSRIELSESIPNELLIRQRNKNMYCVYIGHQKNLRQRFSEHFMGSIGTGCLSLSNYTELYKQQWKFYYFEISHVKKNIQDSNMLRTILENNIRAYFGWPMLCAR
jgi:hypothetical protein